MNCIIPNTHKRLLEAHRLWHQSYDNYFDPEGFRTNINATIQALRNLTFALQNEKEKIVGFDSWYPNWQSKMKNDQIMKWLNEARVKIVHQKDLETQSQAHVLIHSYFNLAEYKFTVPPLLPSELIAHRAKSLIKEKVNIPEHQLKDCIAVIERRWVAADLPDWEILDALAYSFNFVKDIVCDAHKQSGIDFLECPLHDSLHPLSIDDITSRFSCMEVSAAFRTQNIVLSDFQKRTLETNVVKLTDQTLLAAKKRYSSKLFNRFPANKYDPLEFADSLNQIALQVLKKDKYHQWIQFIRVPYKGWEMRSVVPEDKSDKFLIMKELAHYVKETKADCVININEAWISSDVEAIMSGTPVGETLDKEEALCISVITSNGKSRSYTTKFQRRHFGNIKFSETEISEGDPGYFSLPILEVWQSRNKS